VRFLVELNTLLFPVRCYGCRDLGFAICSNCRKHWNPHIYQSQIADLPVYSAIPYSAVARNILLAAKEESQKSADQLIIRALSKSLETLFKNIPVCAIVPIPSQPSANRRRGRDFVSEISISVARECGVAVLPMLHHQRVIRDQSKLNIAARRENLAMALAIKSEYAGNYPAEKVVILDDLITTGATIKEAIRALTKGGFLVQAAATACVAQRRRG
jgi:predicted amidophosphoribosyltransferase